MPPPSLALTVSGAEGVGVGGEGRLIPSLVPSAAPLKKVASPWPVRAGINPIRAKISIIPQ